MPPNALTPWNKKGFWTIVNSLELLGNLVWGGSSRTLVLGPVLATPKGMDPRRSDPSRLPRKGTLPRVGRCPLGSDMIGSVTRMEQGTGEEGHAKTKLSEQVVRAKTERGMKMAESKLWKVSVNVIVDSVTVEVSATSAESAAQLAKSCIYDGWFKRVVELRVKAGYYSEADVNVKEA